MGVCGYIMDKSKVYIRVDSNPVISGGHVMRCLAIAETLSEVGRKVCFLVADDNPISVLEERGFSYINLHSNWQNLMTDFEQVKSIVSKEEYPFLIIDTYKVTKEYVDSLKPYCRIAYLGSKKGFLGNLDLLINYSTDIDYAFYNNSYTKKTRLLLGPSYAPLRKEFQSIIPVYRDEIGHILITTGNTDRNHIVSSLIAKLLPEIDGTTVKLDVVIGRMFDYKDELHKCYDSDARVELHENVESMSALMKECDLAITANGTTVYELSAVGLPSISFAMVEEQVKSAEALSELGVIDYCGRSYCMPDECISVIVKKVRYYMGNHDELRKLAMKAHELIDGNGCSRIVAVLSEV
jgi:UDP-2,4-diacetamido-2,4,6-trideoxy-beta-L-altropyranose hydrolase